MFEVKMLRMGPKTLEQEWPLRGLYAPRDSHGEISKKAKETTCGGQLIVSPIY